jgi:hypothetical protein
MGQDKGRMGRRAGMGTTLKARPVFNRRKVFFGKDQDGKTFLPRMG